MSVHDTVQTAEASEVTERRLITVGELRLLPMRVSKRYRRCGGWREQSAQWHNEATKLRQNE